MTTAIHEALKAMIGASWLDQERGNELRDLAKAAIAELCEVDRRFADHREEIADLEIEIADRDSEIDDLTDKLAELEKEGQL